MATKHQISTLAGVIVSNQGGFESLTSNERQWVIENGEEAVALFVLAIVSRSKQVAEQVAQSAEAAKAIVKKTLTPWKTIEVGGTTTEKLLAAIEKKVNGVKKNEVGDYARDLTTKPAFKIAGKVEKVDLVIMTPSDLGFTTMPRTDAFLTKEFCAEWSAKYLDGQVIELCEPEDGPQLRRQYEDQPNGELLWMAMERITDSDGHPGVFFVGRNGDGERWLNASWANPHDRWHLGYRIVFRLRKIPSPSAT